MRRIVADYPLVAIALALSIFGVAMVYSAGQTDTPTAVERVYKSQIVWLVFGMIGAYAISRSSVRFIEWVTIPAYILSVALLGLTLVVGKGAGTAASTKSWLAIGNVRIGQPSELAKVTVVLMLLASPLVSLILSFSTGLWGAWFLVLLALVLYYRPYLVEGIVLMVANVATGVIAPILWEKLAPYQQNRLRVFIDPSADPRASGYHVIQSKIAIGSGGLFGKGFTLGTQKRLAFLPEQHTDFIFAVVGEEMGFIGVAIALTLFLALFLRITQIAGRANDSYSSLVAFGLMASWFVHVLVNVGMTLNLMPITGIPLPFFSYGGSFMLASWLAIGVLMRISGEGRGKAAFRAS